MLVSIITVVKNDLIRLKKTVSSLHEFYKDYNFEHIIIDGKSDDDTCNFLNKLKLINKNIIFKSSNDLGIYDAMNKGIDLCKGNFILFLNAGDELIISRILLANKLKEFHDIDTHVLCFPFQHVFSGKTIYRNPTKKNKDRLPTSHQAMLFSKSFLKKNNYNLLYKISADFEMYLKAERSKIYLLSSFKPLSKVESEGVASMNFYLSYMEYIRIIFFNYSGIIRVYLINKIILKVCIIKILSFMFSKSIIFKIRKIFY